MRFPNYNYETHNFFVFDGKSSMDFGLGISGNGTYKKPHRRVERFTIPGRNGTLTISDDTFEDIEITYPCYFADGFGLYYQGLMDWLYSKKGMVRLEDTYHPEHFRLAEFVGDVTPDMGPMNFSGRFDLTFRCDGRLFLKSGEREYRYVVDDFIYIWESATQAVKIVNPTPYNTSPLIYTYAAELGNFVINQKRILRPNAVYLPDDVDMLNTRIAIDCETGEAYIEGDINANINEQIEFPDGLPTLTAGDNYISHYVDNIPSMGFFLVPRWYTV